MRCRELAIALGSVVALGAGASVSATEPDGEETIITECSDELCLREFLSGRRFLRAYGERSAIEWEEYGDNGDWTGALHRSARILLTGQWSISAKASEEAKICIRFAERSRNSEFSGKMVCRSARVSENGDLVIGVLVGADSESRLFPD